MASSATKHQVYDVAKRVVSDHLLGYAVLL
jgi:hypothetical protein